MIAGLQPDRSARWGLQCLQMPGLDPCRRLRHMPVTVGSCAGHAALDCYTSLYLAGVHSPLLSKPGGHLGEPFHPTSKPGFFKASRQLGKT
eukprot:362113-Chlamydomonas_euryale.AAC.5